MVCSMADAGLLEIAYLQQATLRVCLVAAAPAIQHL